MKTRAGDCGRLHPAGPTTRVLRRLPLSVTGTASEGGPPWADDASKLQALAQLLGSVFYPSHAGSTGRAGQPKGAASKRALRRRRRPSHGAAFRVRPSPSESVRVAACPRGVDGGVTAASLLASPARHIRDPAARPGPPWPGPPWPGPFHSGPGRACGADRRPTPNGRGPPRCDSETGSPGEQPPPFPLSI